MRSIPHIVALAAAGFAGLTLLADQRARAEWPSDPAVNLAIADGAGSQVQAKAVAAPDGSTYVSWYDGASGYDVRLQRITPSGSEAWAHGGVLVADRSFSSTQDYGLSVDASGAAVVTFRDDRLGGVQISAARVLADGTIDFDVQVSSGSLFFAAPHIAGTTDGDIVVGWTEESDVRVQRLDAAGAPQWGAGVVLTDPAGGLSLGDIADAGDASGAAVLSLVRANGFSSPKHLVAHRLDADGSKAWGETGVEVFVSGSLQFGNFPGIASDGNGGAVLAWYGVGPLQSYVQHLAADGTALLTPDGFALSTDATRIRVSPSAAIDVSTGDIYAFWTELNSAQSQHGISGQRVTPEGDRAWGASGLVVVPVGSNEHGQARTAAHAGGATVAFVDKPSDQRVRAAAYDADGDAAWAGTIVEVSSVLSSKSRLALAQHADGEIVLAWRDGRSDDGDIYAQNLNRDGTLGPSGSVPGDVDGDGVVGVSDLLAVLAAWGDCPPAGECPADLDGDGAVTVSDLLIVLANWS